MTESKNAKDAKDKAPTPTGDGDTYNTSHRRKTGVGNEPPVLDLREGADEEERS